MNIRKLLCVISSMEVGGAETFLMKIFREIDKSKYMFDFCVSTEKKSYYEDEIKSMGGTIYRVPPRSNAPYKRFSMIRKLTAKQKYDCVLVCNQYELSSLDLFAAKCSGVNNLAYRANSTAIASGGVAKDILHKLLRVYAMRIPNIFIAPSEAAATFVFGKKLIEKGKVSFIHNGIDPQKFDFDIRKRNELRQELNVSNNTVLIHIGRFSSEKNHTFMLEAFREALIIRPDLYLLLVGEGPDLDSIKAFAAELDICNNVSFLGMRSDVPQLLMAADLALLPSLYEGMPNVIIEAQGTGLPCVVSDNVTREADISGRVEFIPLRRDNWVEAMLKATNSTDRKSAYGTLVEAGYDISSVVNQFVRTVFYGVDEYVK